VDGLIDGMLIGTSGNTVNHETLISAGWSVMQASRVRITRTEYISCPSCGRTLFNLQQVTAKIREKTCHLNGLKIAIMGCIVNGPGEMADADYGYVGSGGARVTLYRNRVSVIKNIPEDHAVEKLIALIKQDGLWTDPE
jgi:(E)-4-hydroxy-3-methylbut-2-enyl-diphosphate synthase